MSKHGQTMKADNDRRKAARKAFVVGTTVSAERFEEMIQDLLSSFDPDWIGSLAYQQSFKDKLANYIGLAERRGASNERRNGAPAPEAPKEERHCRNCLYRDIPSDHPRCDACDFPEHTNWEQMSERSATT